MAQNITLQGASYSDVPSVVLPKTGGGTASFTDVTDTTASANDVAAGKYFYTAAGVKTEGTSTGGGGTTAGTVTQDANGYLILDDDAPAGPTLITKSITANGTYNASSDSADGYSSVTVNVSGGGGGGDMSDPIRFFDYDGTLVASYSSVPASLPSVPTHTGLTSGTWNYTLAQVQTQFNAMGTCDVGANYSTVSGATEIDIELQEGRLHPYLSLAVKGTVEIDWGDNFTSTSTGISLTTRKTDIHHEYAAAGSYTIKITKTSGTGYSLCCTSTYFLLNNNSGTAAANRVYASRVKRARIGADCTIGNYAFNYCSELESVSIPSTASLISTSIFYLCGVLKGVNIPSGNTTLGASLFNSCSSLANVSIPSSVTQISNAMFSGCYSLQNISIPSGVTSIGNNAFANCYTLQSISIPSGVTVIYYSAFQTCSSLERIDIPSTVAEIGYGTFNGCRSLKDITLPTNLTTINKGSSTSTTTGCFQTCSSLISLTIPSGCTSFVQNEFKDCYGMTEYHFKATTPPTLANVNCFSNIQSDCIIYVPSSKLNDYKTAENWATYADYMVGE